jgi:hypothetical protein
MRKLALIFNFELKSVQKMGLESIMRGLFTDVASKVIKLYS